MDVKTNIAQVLARMESYKRDVLNKAVVLALNRCLAMAKTDAARELRAAGYNINARTVKAAISTREAQAGRLVATLRVNRRPIALIAYDARQTKTGVSVKVRGARKVIKGAFIAAMPTGHRGVFERAPNARHKRVTRNGMVRSTSLPIRQLFGPSVGGAYASATVQAAMERSIRDNFNRRLTHELSRLSK